ncbi:hypothetical protein [Alteromonas gilva]|uniref:Phytanoyl-CoA dioxygenase n=1 Tax=Alteromonas gilva TaxID=2987522 RepID=A0ABT5KXV4_9ALTE|nr:hypothetical protein [Alteromonas gilva]MDC8829608.1 hypothetical protein [Alteromonas gilva]
MQSRPPFLDSLSPHHGKVLTNLIDSNTREKLAKKLSAMPGGDTWYADIYSKAIYGPMLYRDNAFDITNIIAKVLPEYQILADLYLEKAASDQGFPFHTDFDSIGFMERPEEMLTVWIPLVPVNTEGSGQLSVVMAEGAVRLSLIREAHQLHSLLRVVDSSIPAHAPFELSWEEQRYLESSKFTPSLDAGDALLFCNAFFHKSEPVVSQTRSVYILRLVPKDAKFNRARLLALRKLGQNLEVVNALLSKHFPDALSGAATDPTASGD